MNEEVLNNDAVNEDSSNKHEIKKDIKFESTLAMLNRMFSAKKRHENDKNYDFLTKIRKRNRG